MLNQRSSNQNSPQKGVTLLLAVMIVSSLVLIAVTVAALAIRGLRTSRASLFNQPALGAAESGAEDALWGIKRNAVAIPNCTSSSTSVTYANSVSSYCKSYGPTTFNLKSGTDTLVYLYDPNDPNGDTDLTKMDTAYSSVTVTNQTVANTVPVKVYVTKLDGSAIGAQPVSVANGSNQTIAIPSPVAGSDNRMEIKLHADADEIVVVTTNIGLPTVPTVDATGCAGRITPGANCASSNGESFSRRLNVTVPDAGAAAGSSGSSGNVPPSVAITAPNNGQNFPSLADIVFSASASDTDGSVTKVEFYHDGTLIASDTTSPYSTTWNNAPSGTYTLTARAYDDGGSFTNSAPISITVGP
jgi:Tfp pilus assembly protein PilX